MIKVEPWFKDWFNSPYYHQLYFKRDEREAAEFIDHLVERLQPQPGATMIDIACGKGRHSVQLASKGFDVTGIDLSEGSIREAKDWENDNLHFFVHDMRLPFRINYFNFAFNFFTSFGYFDTRREHDNAIRTVAQSLKPNGEFVIDFLNVQYAEEHTIHQSDIEIGDVNFHITKWFDDVHFFKRIIVEDKALDAPLEHLEKVVKFTLEDFKSMLGSHQLKVQEVFGDYDFSDYDVKKSPRLIIRATKIMQ
ncbi:MAG: class I SAM-dependent methyltransferase [Ginsengibacter sp.]|jgi:SAM-dependent methyltransferase